MPRNSAMQQSKLPFFLLLLTFTVFACGPDRGGRGDDDDDDDDSAAGDDDDAANDDDSVPPGDDDDDDAANDDDSVPPGDDDDDMSDDDDSVPPGDDDDMSDDDDSVPPGDDDDMSDDDDSVSPPGALPATGDAPCDGSAGPKDVYLVTLPPGTHTITVDTVSAATTFDPYAYATSDTTTYLAASQVGYDDDTLTCSFPPPMYGCPQFDVSVTVPEQLAIVVYGYTSNCNSSGVGSYELSITGPTAPVSYDQLFDDITF